MDDAETAQFRRYFEAAKEEKLDAVRETYLLSLEESGSFSNIEAYLSLLEEQASDTRENLEFSRTLAQTHGMRTDRVLIITSDFHLCRAKYLAKKLGMEPYGLASRTSPEVLRVNYLLREVFAFVKAAL